MKLRRTSWLSFDQVKRYFGAYFSDNRRLHWCFSTFFVSAVFALITSLQALTGLVNQIRTSDTKTGPNGYINFIASQYVLHMLFVMKYFCFALLHLFFINRYPQLVYAFCLNILDKNVDDLSVLE